MPRPYHRATVGPNVRTATAHTLEQRPIPRAPYGGDHMTRVLVVHHDIDLGDQEVDSLRRLGYEPFECSGPSGSPCPVMRGDDCPDVADADVLLYDVWSTTESGGGQVLVENLRKMYPDTPIVLTAPGMELEMGGNRSAPQGRPAGRCPNRREVGRRHQASAEHSVASSGRGRRQGRSSLDVHPGRSVIRSNGRR